MTTILSVLVAVGFLWSLSLIITAVAVKDRRQEAGFGFTLTAFAVYSIVYTDRLPGHSVTLRRVLDVLPGVDARTRLFHSSAVLLIVIAVIYAYRAFAFYQLYINVEPGQLAGDTNHDGVVDNIDDYFILVVSYATLAACVVSLLRPAYELNAVGTALLVALLAAAFFIRRLAVLFEVAVDLLRYLYSLTTSAWFTALRGLNISIKSLSIVGALAGGNGDAAGRAAAKDTRARERYLAQRQAAVAHRAKILKDSTDRIETIRRPKNKRSSR